MLPTPPQGVQPGPTDFLSENARAAAVPRDSVVVEIALNHAAQPVADHRDRIVAALMQFLSQRFEGGANPRPAGRDDPDAAGDMPRSRDRRLHVPGRRAAADQSISTRQAGSTSSQPESGPSASATTPSAPISLAVNRRLGSDAYVRAAGDRFRDHHTQRCRQFLRLFAYPHRRHAGWPQARDVRVRRHVATTSGGCSVSQRLRERPRRSNPASAATPEGLFRMRLETAAYTGTTARRAAASDPGAAAPFGACVVPGRSAPSTASSPSSALGALRNTEEPRVVARAQHREGRRGSYAYARVSDRCLHTLPSSPPTPGARPTDRYPDGDGACAGADGAGHIVSTSRVASRSSAIRRSRSPAARRRSVSSWNR